MEVRGVREEVYRATGSDEGGRPPEKTRVPREEEGGKENSEFRRKGDGAKRYDENILRPLPTKA